MASILLVYVPCKNRKAASVLAKKLLSQNLIACANLIESQSFYNWKGKNIASKETILVIKTLPHMEKRVRLFIKKHHAYRLPCIASWKINVNNAYAVWVKQQLTI